MTEEEIENMAGATYSIKANRIKRGFSPGFLLEENGTLLAAEQTDVHCLFLKAIDSAKDDSQWGRLRFQMELPENMVCYVYAVALNEDSFYRGGIPTRIEDFLINPHEEIRLKREFMQRAGGVRFVNQSDMLLYELQGKYLYLMLELTGEGKCSISQMKVDLQGDNFMNTFPEIYREHNSFFHRYMSVFSSVYNDFQDDIEALPELLELDTCPAGLLPRYAQWLGIDVGGHLFEEDILRRLVKEAYQLNRIKGTKKVLERIGEIVLGESVLVLERNILEEYMDKEQIQEVDKLYGRSKYDVTILIKNAATEEQKARLMFVMEQFKPLRSRLHLIDLKRSGTLDGYSYLDMNARVYRHEEGSLDKGQALGGMLKLQ